MARIRTPRVRATARRGPTGRPSDGGRIWYFVDTKTSGKHAGRVLIHEVSPGHPKKSERVTGRRR